MKSETLQTSQTSDSSGYQIEMVLGTIPILRQQKDWVGWFGKWSF